jgi:hypothetical protein
VDFTSRLDFLYKAVDDTQNTIRFIDTKAAFCVTLLSCMVAGSLQLGASHPSTIHRISFVMFLGAVSLSLIICMRVIFPVVKPQTATSVEHGRALPKFFIHHQEGHHWIRHTFSKSVGDVLVDDHASYTATLSAATDADLFASMCDELLMVSLIRQIKSDRLQSALLPLFATVFCFMAVMVS